MKLNNIFITHSKKYTAAYYTVEKWLNEAMETAGGFSWVNCSVPDDSESADHKLFINEIRKQIRSSSVFIIISDMYNENKKFMDFEITEAKQEGKYIIGLKPWRNLKPVPKKVSENADELVNLCSSDLINSLTRYFNQ